MSGTGSKLPVAPCRGLKPEARFGRGAFTLVEMVCVMVIITLSAAIATPRFANFLAHQRVEAAARRVAADLAYAQRHAKFTSDSQTVRFNKPADMYTLIGLPHPDFPGQPHHTKLGSEPYEATIKTLNVGGDADLIFDGFGKPDSAATITLAVGKYEKTVIVDGNTGEATVP